MRSPSSPSSASALFAARLPPTLRIDPGFDPNHVLLNQFYLTTNGYSLRSAKSSAAGLRRAHVGAPGVTDVAYSDGMPLGFEPSWWEELDIEGYAPQPTRT